MRFPEFTKREISMSITKDPDLYYADEGEEKNRIRPGTLYLVTTPIGNLSDLSERAKKVLSGVDFVAAEDTRNSAKLLSYFGIKKPLVSYYEHNKRERGELVCRRLSEGESCALVTDAGMPGISDPGEDLVKLCCERGIAVTAVPGPCAALTALTLSGLFTARFSFEGFLTTNKGERTKRLTALRTDDRTLIFYEAPHKLKTTLADLNAALGDRRIALCRELTKLNEEIIRTTLSNAAALFSEREPRGEFVLIVEGATADELLSEAFWQSMSIPEHIAHYIGLGYTKMDAIKACAKDRNIPKNEVYKVTLENKE